MPTAEEEEDLAQQGGSIEGSWAGGVDGMNVTEKLLEVVPVS